MWWASASPELRVLGLEEPRYHLNNPYGTEFGPSTDMESRAMILQLHNPRISLFQTLEKDGDSETFRDLHSHVQSITHRNRMKST